MQNVIQQSINLLERLKASNPVFNFPCPICWFGNLNFRWINNPVQVPTQKRAHKLGDGIINVGNHTLPIILSTAVAIRPIIPDHINAMISRAHGIGL